MPFGWLKSVTAAPSKDGKQETEREEGQNEDFFDSGLGGFGPTTAPTTSSLRLNDDRPGASSHDDSKTRRLPEEEYATTEDDDSYYEDDDVSFSSNQTSGTVGGGALFDEDDYSVQDSVATEDSYDPDTQVKQWKSNRAVDFLMRDDDNESPKGNNSPPMSASGDAFADAVDDAMDNWSVGTSSIVGASVMTERSAGDALEAFLKSSLQSASVPTVADEESTCSKTLSQEQSTSTKTNRRPSTNNKESAALDTESFDESAQKQKTGFGKDKMSHDECSKIDKEDLENSSVSSVHDIKQESMILDNKKFLVGDNDSKSSSADSDEQSCGTESDPAKSLSVNVSATLSNEEARIIVFREKDTLDVARVRAKDISSKEDIRVAGGDAREEVKSTDTEDNLHPTTPCIAFSNPEGCPESREPQINAAQDKEFSGSDAAGMKATRDDNMLLNARNVFSVCGDLDTDAEKNTTGSLPLSSNSSQFLVKNCECDADAESTSESGYCSTAGAESVAHPISAKQDVDENDIGAPSLHFLSERETSKPLTFEEAFDEMSLFDSTASAANTVSSESVGMRTSPEELAKRINDAGFGELFDVEDTKVPIDTIVEGDESESEVKSKRDNIVDTEEEEMSPHDASSVAKPREEMEASKSETQIDSSHHSQEDGHDSSDEDVYTNSSDEGSESDDEYSSKPFTLVVKDAPLLRLENVTSKTRSNIPADVGAGIKHTGGGWGWLGRSKPTLTGISSESEMGIRDVQGGNKALESDPKSKQDGTETPQSEPVTSKHDDTARSKKSKREKKAKKNKEKKKRDKNEKKSKASKSKEQSDLSKHLGKISVRKMGRHGDEVSVGTTTRKRSDTHVVVQSSYTTIDNERDVKEESKRPWEENLPPRSPKFKASKLGITGFVEEGSFSHSETDHGEVMESAESSKGQLAFLEVNDELAELTTLKQLESELAANPEDGIDFDDMWDAVSCDPSTARHFERKRKKKKKNKDKKKKKDGNGSKVEALQLFDPETTEGGTNERLSSEFAKAIKSVFDDQSVVSMDEMSQASELTFTPPDCRGLQRQGSITSLYIGSEGQTNRKEQTEPSLDSESEEESSDSDDDTDRDDDDDESIFDSHQQFRARKRRSSKKKSKRRKPRLSAAEQFDLEMKKAQAAKSVSVVNLRQEMSHCRGASVNLVQREYDRFRKNHHEQQMSYDSSDVCGEFNAVFDDNLFKKPSKLAFIQEEEDESCGDELQGRSKGLSNELIGALENRAAGWGEQKSTSGVDDLITIQSAQETVRGSMQSLVAKLAGSADGHNVLHSPPRGAHNSPDKHLVYLSPRKASQVSPVDCLSPLRDVMPLSTITESDDDEADSRRLVSCRDDDSNDDSHSVSTQKSTSSFFSKASSPLKMKLPKIMKRKSQSKKDGPIGGMDLLGDNDERGLLG